MFESGPKLLRVRVDGDISGELVIKAPPRFIVLQDEHSVKYDYNEALQSLIIPFASRCKCELTLKG